MKEYFDLKIVKNAELMLRVTMSVTLLVAGISKFFSHGGFYRYYVQEFAKEGLRISLPGFLFDGYLAMIPYLEVGIGLALITTFKRRVFIVVWIIYFMTLEIGHYVLEQFQAVNMMIPYIVMGTLAYVLPAHDFGFNKTAGVDLGNK
jgi:uncharacterized membrane protein YphA (DoxX/SURF4 family)